MRIKGAVWLASMPRGQPDQFNLRYVLQLIGHTAGSNSGASWHSMPALFDGVGDAHAAHCGVVDSIGHGPTPLS